jgi:hypothetical protein
MARAEPTSPAYAAGNALHNQSRIERSMADSFRACRVATSEDATSSTRTSSSVLLRQDMLAATDAIPNAREAREAHAMARSFMMSQTAAFAPVLSGGMRAQEGELQDVVQPDQPCVATTRGVFDSSGHPIIWPWDPRSSARSEPRKRAMPCDALLHQAMLAASADGQCGESTTGVRAWKEFCRDLGQPYLRPLDPNAPLAAKLAEEHLCMQFVCTLVQTRGVQPQTAANYFGQVQGFIGRTCGVKLCGGLKLARLPAMLKGLRRLVGETPRKLRRGVAGQALRRAMDLCLRKDNPQHANIRAALAVAFQALLRSAEYCSTSNSKTGVSKLLERLPSRADVVELDADKLVLMACPCKNMAHLNGKTMPLIIGAGGTYVDAVEEVRNLLQVDPVPDALKAHTPLFRDMETGRPLHADFMRDTIKRLMARIGENPDDFGTHSLRIGGATSLFAAGATPTVIRTMGRWSSDCYRLYVRACYEASMAWTRKAGSTRLTDVQGEFDEVDEY